MMPNSPPKYLTPRRARPAHAVAAGRAIGRKQNMTQTQTIPETFLELATRETEPHLPLEAVRVPKQFVGRRFLFVRADLARHFDEFS